jgi:hypothetical protein
MSNLFTVILFREVKCWSTTFDKPNVGSRIENNSNNASQLPHLIIHLRKGKDE